MSLFERSGFLSIFLGNSKRRFQKLGGFAVVFVLAPQLLAADGLVCRKLFEVDGPDLAALNQNVTIEAGQYRFEHSRSLDEYAYFLGRNFWARVGALGSQDLVVDLGGGLGLAPLQLSLNRSSRSIVVNAQDFPAHWRKAWSRLRSEKGAAVKLGHRHTGKAPFPDTYWIESIAGLSRSDLANVGDALGMELPGFIEKARSVRPIDHDAVANAASEILEAHFDVRQSPLFEYRVARAEVELPKIESAKIVTSVFGAFYYSADRVGLLNSIDRSIAVDGRGYLSLMGFIERGISDEVRLRDGRIVSFIEYLLEREPEVYSLEGSLEKEDAKEKPPVLIVKKRAHGEKLRLELDTVLPSYRSENMVVPRVRYRESSS